MIELMLPVQLFFRTKVGLTYIKEFDGGVADNYLPGFLYTIPPGNTDLLGKVLAGAAIGLMDLVILFDPLGAEATPRRVVPLWARIRQTLVLVWQSLTLRKT